MRLLVLVLMLLNAVACNQSPETTAAMEGGPPKPDVLEKLRESAFCAEQAEKFWKRGGYASEPQKPDEFWSYTSHFNAEREKCLIQVKLVTFYPNSRATLWMVSDAIENREIATLHVQDYQGRDRKTWLMWEGKHVEHPTPEDFARFDALMGQPEN